MLSHDLKELSATFDAWCSGERYVTVEAWATFQRDLRTSVAKAALLELGIPVNVLDIAAEVAKPGSNIALFPTPAQRSRETSNGGTA